MLQHIQADPLVWVPGGCGSLFTRPPVFPSLRGSTEAQVSATVYGLVFRATIGNPSLKLVLLALADNANDEGYCYPSIAHLVQKSELGKRQIIRYLDRLEEDGLMRRESGVGRGNNSEYWLNLEAIQEKVSSMTPKREKVTSQKVTSTTVKGVIQDRKGDIFDTYKEETSEPSLEPSFSLTSSEPPKKTLHAEVKEYIDSTYQKRFGVPVTWDGSEAKNLSSILAANPAWTLPIFRRLIDNRYASEGVNGERPRIWLSDLGRYLGGPLDKYGNPKQQSSPIIQREVTISERMRALAAGNGR